MNFGQQNLCIMVNVNQEYFKIFEEIPKGFNQSLKPIKVYPDFNNEVKCNNCCQKIQFNIFFEDETKLFIKIKEEHDLHTTFIEELPILTEPEKEIQPSTPKSPNSYDDNYDVGFQNEDPDYEKTSENESSSKERSGKVKNKLSKPKTDKASDDSDKSIKCISSTFDDTQKLWRQEYSNGEVFVTNFDLECKMCDICNISRSDLYFRKLMKHRLTHFIGGKNTSTNKSIVCLACCKVFNLQSDLEHHALTCDQKHNLDCVRFNTMYVPEGVILPKLPVEKKTFCIKAPQKDGTAAYVERFLNGVIRVTNYNPKQKICDICGQKIKSDACLKAHRIIHFFQLLDDPDCVGCGETFSTLESKRRHILYCLKKDTINPLKCIRCQYESKNFQRLRTHVSFKHGSAKNPKLERVLCHICSKVVLKMRMAEHIKCHESTDGKAFECYHCNKRLSTYSGLKLHLTRAHFPHLAPYKCHICDYGSRAKTFLQMHLQNKHSIGKKNSEVPCEICSKILKSAASLKQHMLYAHTNPSEKQKFFCDVCHKGFFSKYYAEKHQLEHRPDNEKQYKCKFCSKKFANKQKLKRHQISHSEDPNLLHYCSTCGKGMKYKESLIVHMRIHTGEQPYECKVCKKKFADRGNFRLHCKNHEKELGVKLTLTAEERRLIKMRVLNPEDVLTTNI